MIFFSKQSPSDNKAFWKLYKTITRKDTSIPTLQEPVSGLSITDCHTKANILNEQFFKNFNHAGDTLTQDTGNLIQSQLLMHSMFRGNGCLSSPLSQW